MATILIADDDAAIREMLAAVLEDEEGYSVVLAANGRDALDHLRSTSVDALVCDINMPIMDGLELVRAIRATPAIRDLPVLLMSAILPKQHHTADLTLAKPFEISTLLACIRRMLTHTEMAARRAPTRRRHRTHPTIPAHHISGPSVA